MRKTAGVTHVTIFTRPDVCGGACLYCPKVPDLPKSYLPHSDIKRYDLDYNSQDQLRYWLDDNKRRGGVGSKLEVLVLGGSFTAHPFDYQNEFLRGIYLGVEGRPDDGSSLEALVANHHHRQEGRRVIGITVESRPNLITAELAERLFDAGVTKIEIGVQSLDDGVLKFNDRGHYSDEVARATRIIKDAGLKIGYHLLFGMPGASHESDVDSALRVFEDSAFQPDHLKVYFCEMFKREFMRDRLVKLYDAGEWVPLGLKERHRLMEDVMPKIPRYIRVSRIGRKIAGDEMEGELHRLNRSDIEREYGCRCVRCREPYLNRHTDGESAEIAVTRVSDCEFFIEARPTEHDVCLGLLRLRLHRKHGVVRELHVYGTESRPGEEGRHQHRGIGKRLMEAAEKLTREEGRQRLAVASGVGVRTYYERLGYRIEDDSMVWKEIGRDSPEPVSQICSRTSL